MRGAVSDDINVAAHAGSPPSADEIYTTRYWVEAAIIQVPRTSCNQAVP